MNSNNYIRLSKVVSHALRHEPQAYNLKLDDQGWVLLSDLVFALNSKGMQINERIIIKMIRLSNKKRHQLLDGRIRAYYGHSIENKILKEPSKPPVFLFHGTVQHKLNNIIKKGLLPMERQYLHLSAEKSTARKVGSRKKGELVILKVKAKEAFLNNIKFYKGNNDVWLADVIPPKFIIF